MEELKPCPFCGEKAAIGCDWDCYDVYCIGCNAHIELDGMEDAIEAWNRRVSE